MTTSTDLLRSRRFAPLFVTQLLNALNDNLNSEDQVQPGRPAAPAGEVVEGMTVAPLTDALRQRYSIAESVRGLVITAVTDTSRAGRAGVPAGTVRDISGAPVGLPGQTKRPPADARGLRVGRCG